MKPVYQTDSNGIYLYETRAAELPLSPGDFNIPFGAYEDAPPPAPHGYVAQREATGWKLVEDHRGTNLRITSTGEPYQLGTEAGAADESVVYNGIGPIPDWLTVYADDADAVAPKGEGPHQPNA
ncbi:phage tail protein [Achromobacter mucicolens]|uniref:phage tail protein n=1 Tax=Achromobacter mucicolens TaxID=1389922 RepID=UPI0020A41585|nr:phage tail protein [Achromobacter mucicolens]MCP2517041.1 phage tail protein [Achromobacter mucicolens]